jgi:hypothetical protein
MRMNPQRHIRLRGVLTLKFKILEVSNSYTSSQHVGHTPEDEMNVSKRVLDM